MISQLTYTKAESNYNYQLLSQSVDSYNISGKAITYPVEEVLSLASLMITTSDVFVLIPVPKPFYSLPEEELSKMTMSLSTNALKEEWDNEDDNFWASF